MTADFLFTLKFDDAGDCKTVKRIRCRENSSKANDDTVFHLF
jgi:hypothetical protein